MQVEEETENNDSILTTISSQELWSQYSIIKYSDRLDNMRCIVQGTDQVNILVIQHRHPLPDPDVSTVVVSTLQPVN